ncbi:MAG TPA: hypothetical protein VF955_01675 [Pyrinomonadaceae bacterium]
MSIETWTGVLAFLLMMLGAGVSIHPPRTREWKIALFCAFAVTGICLLVLTYIQARDRTTEQRQAETAQNRLQESADQNRQELVKVKGQLDEIVTAASKPGSADDRLGSVLDSIDKVLGKPTTSRFAIPSAPPVNPISTLTAIPIKAGDSQRLDVLMKGFGYLGSTDMAVLTVYNNEENPNEIYTGTRPDLNVKNSHRLYGGESDNFQGGEDTARVWIRSPKDGKIDVDFRPRN